MKIILCSKKNNYFRNNIAYMLLMYWFVLVLWQNIGGVQAKSAGDIIIKIFLLIYFVKTYLKKSLKVSKNALWGFLLVILLLITFFREQSLSLNIIISYIYPVMFVFMAYGIGNKLEINRMQLLSFCKGIVFIVLYSALYAFIFCFDQFQGASSINSAYGNELSSFFLSNFEYAMYLVAGIVSCILCMKIDTKLKIKMKIFYIIAIIIFSVNLLFTYSRTAILSIAIFLILYLIFQKGKERKWIMLSIILIGGFILLQPNIIEFIQKIVFKGNNLGSREDLFGSALTYFQQSSYTEKMFGHGIVAARGFFESRFDHGSIHNGYLQVLIYYGIPILVLLISFLLMQIYNNLKLMKSNRFLGTVFLGMAFVVITMMFTTTALLFTSSIESYFLTIFFIIVPKYVRNSIKNGNF